MRGRGPLLIGMDHGGSGTTDEGRVLDAESVEEDTSQDSSALDVSIAVDSGDQLERNVWVGMCQGKGESIVDIGAGAHGQIGVEYDACRCHCVG